MLDNKIKNKLTQEETKKNTNSKSTEIYHQQAIETFSWLSKKK